MGQGAKEADLHAVSGDTAFVGCPIITLYSHA